jgi:tight adherence protein C
MILLYVFALVGMFAAAAVAVYGLMPSPSQMYDLKARTTGRSEAATITSPIIRLLWPVLAALAPHVRKLGSEKYHEEKARELPLAGFPAVMQVDHLLALKVLMAVCVPVMLANFSEAFQSPPFFLLAAALGYFVPDRVVTEQRLAREQKILRSLPAAVDILTLAVEAGQDFLTALQRVVDKGPTGPLRQEVTTIITDIRLGDTRAGALRAFARRIAIPEVVSFVGILIQAEKLGASIGSVLRSQADRMRTERFQRAEKEGAKASQKILVPLAVFIFPAVLLVIVGPAVLSFMFGPQVF